MNPTTLLLVLAFLSALLTAGEAPIATVELTVDEVAVLQLANQHRLERAAFNNRITHQIATKRVVCNKYDWLAATNGNPMPPLVFNPTLADAARSLLKNGARPPEKKTYDPALALKQAGYASDKPGLALFGLECPDLSTAYGTAMATVIGVRKWTGDQLLDILAVSEAMAPQWREIGVAAAFAKGKASVVIVLGEGTAKRYVGGHTYTDTNRDLSYDIGEGNAGVSVTCGAASMTTGASGIWWLALDSDAESEVVFSDGNFTAKRPIAKGTSNLTIDWRMPNPADLKTADRLIADAERAAKNVDMDKKREQLAALLTGTRMAALDDARQLRVTALTEQLQGEFDLAMGKIMGALGEEPADFKKTLGDIRKNWKHAMPAWFKEAEGLSKLRQQVNVVLAAPEEQKSKLAGPVLQQVQKAKAVTIDPKFLFQYITWEEQLAEIMPEKVTLPRK